MRPVSRPFIICAKPWPGVATQDRRHRDAAVVERQLARLDALVAELGQIPRHRQPRPVLHQHDREAQRLYDLPRAEVGRGRRLQGDVPDQARDGLVRVRRPVRAARAPPGRARRGERLPPDVQPPARARPLAHEADARDRRFRPSSGTATCDDVHEREDVRLLHGRHARGGPAALTRRGRTARRAPPAARAGRAGAVRRRADGVGRAGARMGALPGSPRTVVFADTCGYHKQQKPESGERLLLVSHYVSGTPYVPRALELRGVDEGSLTNEHYVASTIARASASAPVRPRARVGAHGRRALRMAAAEPPRRACLSARARRACRGDGARVARAGSPCSRAGRSGDTPSTG